MKQQPLLEVRDLKVHYVSTHGIYKVVDGTNLMVYPKEIFGIAGESGCGKSTTVEAILRLIHAPGTIAGGEIIFAPNTPDIPEPIDLVKISQGEMRRLRWEHISYVPQGSMNSLNPVMRIGRQIGDAIQEHTALTKEEIQGKIREALTAVALPPAVDRSYPHELSGGMRQRAIIASGITMNPELIICDEPTTALDVNVQRLILQELKEIRDEFGLSIIFVSHDMSVHAELVDRMGVMYAGQVVEIGDTTPVFKKPLHPYTQGLINSIPTLGGERKRLEGIRGIAPSPLNWPQGCRFHPRCPFAMEICRVQQPTLAETEAGRYVACHLYPSSTKPEPDLAEPFKPLKSSPGSEGAHDRE